jgi:hypothetical protein
MEQAVIYVIAFAIAVAIYTLALYIVGNAIGNKKATLGEAAIAACIMGATSLLTLMHFSLKFIVLGIHIAIVQAVFECGAFGAFIVCLLTGILVWVILFIVLAALFATLLTAVVVTSPEAMSALTSGPNSSPSATVWTVSDDEEWDESEEEWEADWEASQTGQQGFGSFDAFGAPTPTPAVIKPAPPVGTAYQLSVNAALREEGRDDILIPAGAWVQVKKVHENYQYVEARLANGTSLGFGWLVPAP